MKGNEVPSHPSNVVRTQTWVLQVLQSTFQNSSLVTFTGFRRNSFGSSAVLLAKCSFPDIGKSLYQIPQVFKCCLSLWRFLWVLSNAIASMLARSPGWISLLMATAVYLSGFWTCEEGRAGCCSPQAAAESGWNRTAALRSEPPSNRH